MIPKAVLVGASRAWWRTQLATYSPSVRKMWTSAAEQLGLSARLPAVPTIPRLGISADVTNIRLTWPTNANGVTLQFATSLAGGGDWQDQVAMPVLEGDQQVVTIKREAIGSRFFRLRKP